MLILALILAQLLNSPDIKGKGIYRTMIFLPCATSLVSYSMIFKSLFANDGLVNRVLSFLKLTFLEGISWKITRRLFHVDARSACEKKVIRLARQTPLSCAEIIKCIEMDIRRLKDGYDVLDKLYDDNDLNCDNFAQAVREYRCSHEVITAVANLYLRQQIMIDTY